MKEHFFTSSTDGALYDTRDPNWSTNPPLRAIYRRHFQDIKSAQELKATLRAGSSTDVGGYPLYFIANDGESLSFEAVRENLRSVLWSIQNRVNDGWRIVACDINYEEPDLICAHSGKRIPSAYGDDDEPESEQTLSVDDGTLDRFIQDYCRDRDMPIDGDIFGHLFSEKETFSPAEARAIIERGFQIEGYGK